MNRQNKPRAYSTRVYLEQDGEETYFVAIHPELEGAIADGMTPDEATQNLNEVTEMILDHLRENNLPIPEPSLIFEVEVLNVTQQSRETQDPKPDLKIQPLIFTSGS